MLLLEHPGPQFASPLLDSFREHFSDEQVAAFKGFRILDYLLMVFEVLRLSASVWGGSYQVFRSDEPSQFRFLQR